MPIPLFLCILSIPYYVISLLKRKNKTIEKNLLIIILSLVFYILWSLVINFLKGTNQEYLISQFIYPLIALYLIIVLREESIKWAIYGLYLCSIILFCYGLYGFITWNTGNITEHLFGYFGITYLAATRNGDLVYLFPALIMSYIFFSKSNNWILKTINIIIFTLILIAIIANQSRGGLIVIFVFLIVYKIKFSKSSFVNFRKWNPKILIILFLLFGILAFLLFKYVDKIYIDIIYDRATSIFSLESKSDLTYNSNQERLNILAKSFNVIGSNIFGVGFTGFRDITNGEFFHSENTFVSVMLFYGVPSFVFFILMLYYAYKNILISIKIDRLNNYSLIIYFLFISILIYAFMNSLLEMLPFWMICGLFSAKLKINKKNNEASY